MARIRGAAHLLIRCPVCGYDLRGLGTLRDQEVGCPECGGRFNPAELKRCAGADSGAITPEFGALAAPALAPVLGLPLLLLVLWAMGALGVPWDIGFPAGLLGLVLVALAWLGLMVFVPLRVGGAWAIAAGLALHVIFAVYAATAIVMVMMCSMMPTLLELLGLHGSRGWVSGPTLTPATVLLGGPVVLVFVCLARWWELRIRKRCGRLHIRRLARVAR